MDDLQKKFLANYDSYSEAIYRHCFFRVFSRARAEDLVQETFMKAWQYLSTGEEVQNVRAFLYKIATNLIIDDSRKKKEVSLDSLLESKSGFVEPAASDQYSSENQLLLKDIHSALVHLDAEEKELITLRYFDDLDPKDIASIKNLSANHISVKLNRAVSKLKSHFNKPS